MLGRSPGNATAGVSVPKNGILRGIPSEHFDPELVCAWNSPPASDVTGPSRHLVRERFTRSGRRLRLSPTLCSANWPCKTAGKGNRRGKAFSDCGDKTSRGGG